MPFWSITTCFSSGQRLLGDLIFPPCCLACFATDDLPDDNIFLCTTCRTSALAPEVRLCPRCALPTAGPERPDCAQCANQKLPFSRTFAMHKYDGPLREMVLQMKHPGGESLALSAGKWLGQKLREANVHEEIDVVLPISMHWLARLMRGYHAADAIATGCAAILGKPCLHDVLVTRRWTKKQGTLTRGARRRNMRNAFGVSRRYVMSESRVLLVDDVITTGSTMIAAAKALQQAGVPQVFVAAIARGTGT